MFSVLSEVSYSMNSGILNAAHLKTLVIFRYSGMVSRHHVITRVMTGGSFSQVGYSLVFCILLWGCFAGMIVLYNSVCLLPG